MTKDCDHPVESLAACRFVRLCAVVFVALLLSFFPVIYITGAEESREFFLSTAAGETHTGSLLAINDQGAILLSGSKPTRTAGTDVISLRRQSTALPGFPACEQVILANGDQIPGKVQDLIGERFRFQASVGSAADWSIPLSHVAMLWTASPEGTPAPDALRRRLSGSKRTRDLVLLRNGDAMEGILIGLDRKQLQIEVEKREVSVLFNQVAVIALNSELIRTARPKEAYAHLVLGNGGRLSLTGVRADTKLLRGKTSFGSEVSIALDQLIALDWRQGRAVYLSDLKPARYEFTPYLDERWPIVLDGSVAGRDLRMGGNTFDKGIGIHSEAKLTYDLGGAYQRFEALVGLDEQTGREGSVRVKVLVDGKARDLAWNKDLTGRDAPLPIRVNVTAAKELTLLVEFGSGGNIQDHVDWVDARLIR